MGEKFEGYSDISLILFVDWTLLCARYIGYEAMNLRYVEHTQNIKINWLEGAMPLYTYHLVVLDIIYKTPS